MSDKPVYQGSRNPSLSWKEITQEEFNQISESISKGLTGIFIQTLYPSAAYEALKAENEKLEAHFGGALDSIREHQQICNALKAENEVLRKKIEDVANVLGCQSALDKLEIVDRITSALVPPKNGDSK